MESIFEKRGKLKLINQLKINLISRFYPFTPAQIRNYKAVLNFDRDHLMMNSNIHWDIDLLEFVQDKIDWTAIWKIKNIVIDLTLLRKFDQLIDFESIQYSNSIVWTEELIDVYSHKFDWSKYLITKIPFGTIDRLRKFKDILDWRIVSSRIKIAFTDKEIEEFYDSWDWFYISRNPNLPITEGFLKKYKDKLDFTELSRNPACLPMIIKYPYATHWDWKNVIVNPGLVYDDSSFNFIFSYFEKYFTSQPGLSPLLKDSALNIFLFYLFSDQRCNIKYFMNEKFQKFIPWNELSRRNDLILDIDFVIRNKEKINFRERGIIMCIRELVNQDFVEENKDLFDPNGFGFYELPLTIEILKNHFPGFKFNHLSSCEKLDWNWNFIEENIDEFNLFSLSANIGVFNLLIKRELHKSDVDYFLLNR